MHISRVSGIDLPVLGPTWRPRARKAGMGPEQVSAEHPGSRNALRFDHAFRPAAPYLAAPTRSVVGAAAPRVRGALLFAAQVLTAHAGRERRQWPGRGRPRTRYELARTRNDSRRYCGSLRSARDTGEVAAALGCDGHLPRQR